MPTITKAQATAEIARRAMPKETRPRSEDPATFQLSGKELAKFAGARTKAAAAAKKAAAKAKPAPAPAPEVDPALKAEANEAFRAAFAAAPEGDKRAAAGKAYRLVIQGTLPLADVLAAIAG